MSYWRCRGRAQVDIGRGSDRIVTEDGAGAQPLWTPPAGALAYRRGTVAPARRLLRAATCPLLAAAAARLGFGTLPEQRHRLPARSASSTSRRRSRRCTCRAARAVVLFGKRRRLVMALARAAAGAATRAVSTCGPGVFMGQVIDPPVADENDPLSVVPELDMYDPDSKLASLAGASLRARLPFALPRGAARAHRTHRRDRTRGAGIGGDGAPRGAPPREGLRRLAPRAPPSSPHAVHDDLPHARRSSLSGLDDRARRSSTRLPVRLPRPVRRQLRPRRLGRG